MAKLHQVRPSELRITTGNVITTRISIDNQAFEPGGVVLRRFARRREGIQVDVAVEVVVVELARERSWPGRHVDETSASYPR